MTAIPRVLQGSAATLTAQFTDASGNPATPTNPTADIASLAQTSSTGTNPVVVGRALTGTGSGVYTLALTPADTANLDTLTATFKQTGAGVYAPLAGQVEVVGDLLFSVAEARAFDQGQLASSTAYPDGAIEAARDRIHANFERICRVNFGARYRLSVLDGSPEVEYGLRDYRALTPRSHELVLPDLLPQSLTSVEYRTPGQREGAGAWTAYTGAEFEDAIITPDARLVRDTGGFWPIGTANIRVGYTAGYPTVPEQIKRAALMVLLYELIPTSLSPRATSMSDNQGGVYRLAVAGVQRNAYSVQSWYGIPPVDAALSQWRHKTPAIG